MKKVLPFVFVAWGCGSTPSSDPNIVGGTKVKETSPIAKEAVALSTVDGQIFCSGVLVAPKVVLTAAHCLEELPDGEVNAVFGRDGNRDPVVIKADSYLQHPLYSPQAMQDPAHLMAPADLGLMILPDAAPQDYKPVRIVPEDMDVKKGITINLAGYGITSAKGKKAGVLREVKVKLKNIWHDAKEIEVQGTKGKGACMGDSGGPAIVSKRKEHYLLAITSRGAPQCNKTGIYTDVRGYSAWVNEQISAVTH